MPKIGLLGGDKREELLISLLSDEGYYLKILNSSTDCSKSNIEYTTDLKELINECKFIIVSMSGTDEKGYLKSTFVNKKVKLDSNFVELLNKDQLLFIGIARPILKKPLLEKDIPFIEMAKLNDVAILNGIPTAEGAIKVAIDKTNFTIYNSKILVSGLGKIGLTLAWRLKALGAEIYSVTRDRGAIARGKDLGFNMIDYRNLQNHLAKMDIIFNTVPAMIFDSSLLKKVNNNVLIIDLASSPGGTDFQAAERLGLEAYLVSGLPGKAAPKTSATIMADVIKEEINSFF